MEIAFATAAFDNFSDAGNTKTSKIKSDFLLLIEECDDAKLELVRNEVW